MTALRAETRALKPAWRQGQSGNPCGGSAKATARKQLRSRLADLRKAVCKQHADIDAQMCAATLVDGMNYTAEELKRLMTCDLTPFAVKVMLKEMAVNPEYALRLFAALQKAGETLPTETRESERQALTQAQAQESVERLKEILKQI